MPDDLDPRFDINMAGNLIVTGWLWMLLHQNGLNPRLITQVVDGGGEVATNSFTLRPDFMESAYKVTIERVQPEEVCYHRPGPPDITGLILCLDCSMVMWTEKR